MSDAAERVRAITSGVVEAKDHREVNALSEEFLELVANNPTALAEAELHLDSLVEELSKVKVKMASNGAHLAALMLLTSNSLPTAGVAHPEFARGGPANEVALAAFHFLRFAGEILPISPEQIEAALDEPDSEPDFTDYPAVFAATIAHLSTAAYYLLDAEDSHDAIASEPPEQETFPPLPFPRIWIEMTHLQPYMRFADKREGEGGARRETMDMLGAAIAEIEQGRVWDVYFPIKFDQDAEFFVLAMRIAPGGVISCDDMIYPQSVKEVRDLAVAGAHLITARNVPTEAVTLPRHQRKRLDAAVFPKGQPSIYFVNLSASGEHGSSGAGSREYHVRWLVRGHWRHTDSGRTFCTCCQPPQIASWVAAYIKGPVGAPWKGRQLRRTHGSPTSTTAADAASHEAPVASPRIGALKSDVA